jgi:hypothetical protein
MPVIEETDACGEIRRKFVATTTAERRRDRAVRAVLRRNRVAIIPDVYARVWDAAAKVESVEAVAVLYQLELARRSSAQISAAGLALAAKQIRKAAAALGTVTVPLSLPATATMGEP